MPLKNYKPTSPGRRGYVSVDQSGITTSKPHKPLAKTKKERAGRNNAGRVTVRHRGGGAKRRIRTIDWRRDKYGIPAKVATIEYDPNRSGLIALLQYTDGEKRYILAPSGLTVGEAVRSGPDAELKVGNALPLAQIPDGTTVHCVELKLGRGGQLARAAGASLQLMAKDRGWATLRLPSGEMRLVDERCIATIGVVGNEDHSNAKVGKAGRKRWMGWRPTVRGSAMSAGDHPHGGGEGKASIGFPPKTPWGKPALGYKTRRGRRQSDKLILRRKRS